MFPIHYFSEDIIFEIDDEAKTSEWIKSVVTREGHQLGELNFIYCSDDYLHQINLEYLNHDTYTDIITFDNSDEEKTIEGDVFISISRVKENADKLNVDFNTELHRVIIHGVLHLLGYKDKNEEEKKVMRKREEACLSLRK